MSQWRQKKMQSQRIQIDPEHKMQNIGDQNTKYTAPRFNGGKPAHRPAHYYNNKSRPWHSKKPALDFKHRSNRYRQYYNNNKDGHYDYSSNSNKYHSKRQYRNYEFNQSNSSQNKKAKATYDTTTKINPKYLYTPQPETSSLRTAHLVHLDKFDYLMRVKSGGMNVKCYITQNSVYFIDPSFNVRMLTDVFYGSHGFVSDNKLTLFDGELFVAERKKNSERNLFYRVTDCIVFEGKLVANKNSSVRCDYITKFMRVYTTKLRQYAKKRSNSSSSKSHMLDDDFVPGDDVDTPQCRLLSISRLLDHNYQHTKNIKNSVINYCKSCSGNKVNKRSDERKAESDDDETDNAAAAGGDDDYVLDGIELNVVSVVFTQATHYKATKKNLQKLSLCIEYKQDSNNNGYAYYYNDIATGVRSKSEGILFIPENNNYLMKRQGSGVEVQRVWKPVDLLTVDIKILKCSKEDNDTQRMKKNVTNDNSLKEMDNFIDGNILNMYVYDDKSEKKNAASSLLWFNSIDMGENDVNDGVTPFWTEWHLKQRSTLCHFVSVLHQQEKHPINEFIAECNYDFNKKSWSLYKLKLDAKRPSTLTTAQNVISQMEEFLQINDLIEAIH